MYHLLVLGAIAAAVGIGEWGQTKWSDHKKWKAKWRQLRKGSSSGTVRQLLGEPKSVQVDRETAVWAYTLGGVVILAEDKLVAWTEPR